MEEQIEQLRYPIGRFERPEQFTPKLLGEWIKIIEVLPRWLDVAIENLDHAQLQTPYREGGWTIQQVIHHIADSHINAYTRLKLALTEDNPVIKPYAEALWADLSDTELVPVNISVTLLHALHRRWVALLQNMEVADWQKTYYHPESKTAVPLWVMTAMYAWHSRHHTEHIMQLRGRMGW